MRKRDNFNYLSVDWRIILKWILKKWNGRVWIGFIWLRIWTGVGIL
jgi:hypothetical protein